MNNDLITVDSILHAKFIIPVIPKDTYYKNHCIVINDNKILEIIPSEDADQKYSAKSSFNLNSHALIPGLINAHGHSAMTLFRGLADDLPLMEWLNNHIWPAEGAWVSEAFVHDGTELAVAEMIKSGTTCFSDMYFFPNVSAQVADRCGIRAQLCCPILDFPTIWGTGPDDYIEKASSLIKSYKNHPLISIGYGPHAPYTVSDEPLIKIKKHAIENQAPVQIHLHETQFEVEEAVKTAGTRPIQRLSEIGLISDELPLQCVHMTALNDDDIELLANSSASVVHCPESNLKLASGFCQVEKLLKAGVNVSLGTDGAASNNDLDMFGEMRTAALIAKPIANDARAVDAKSALELATINGAKTLGLEKHIGSLESGKLGDIIAIDLDRLNSQPSFDIVSDIVYSVSSNQVTHSWINGTPVMIDRNLCMIDENEVINKAIEWSDRINSKQNDL